MAIGPEFEPVWIDVTAHGDSTPQYMHGFASLSSGASESPEERRERLKAEWDKMIARHLKRQTLDAWIADGSDELVPEYLERVCRNALEDITDRAKYLWDGEEWMAYAKERLGL